MFDIHNYRDAFEQGSEAYKLGYKLKDCPYDSSDAAIGWTAGWQSACNEDLTNSIVMLTAVVANNKKIISEEGNKSKTPYEEGYLAWEQGVQRDHNPYFIDTDPESWAEWDKGWDDAYWSYQDYLSGQEE